VPRPTYAEINLSAIRRNFRALRGLVNPGVRMAGIVKADAYGHGAVPVARALVEEGAALLAVALVEEGVELRRAGLAAPILVMGPLPFDEIPAVLEHDLAVTVDDLPTARELDRRAAGRTGRVAVHLKVDTGMNRLGVRAEAAPDAVAEIAGLGHLALEGVYTHFACADADCHPATPDQLARFRWMLAALESRHLRPPLVHAVNSSALILLPDAHYDMVRPGLALYGIHPCEATAGRVTLEPAMALRTEVAHLKHVRRGEGASYGHTWRAERDSILGLLPIGYADGLPRALSNRGQVRADGRLCPVRGIICMDITLVDLTDVPAARVGLPVTVMEASNSSPLGAAALAKDCGTISHEILTGVGKRVPRRYV
jgi:alanine racemase